MEYVAISGFSVGYAADSLAARRGEIEPRAPGRHLTDLIKAADDLARGKLASPDHYQYDPQAPESFPPEVRGIMDAGRLWEEAARDAVSGAATAMGLQALGPQQQQFDGIWLSVDGLLTNAAGQVVGIVECKMRFSEMAPPPDREYWMRQCKGYCKVYGVNVVWMPILAVTSRPPTATATLFALQFTDQEIEENWTMLSNTRDYLDRRTMSTQNVYNPPTMPASFDPSDMADGPARTVWTPEVPPTAIGLPTGVAVAALDPSEMVIDAVTVYELLHECIRRMEYLQYRIETAPPAAALPAAAAVGGGDHFQRAWEQLAESVRSKGNWGRNQLREHMNDTLARAIAAHPGAAGGGHDRPF